MPSPFNQPRDNMLMTDSDGKKKYHQLPVCRTQSVQHAVGILILFLVTKKQEIVKMRGEDQ